RAIELPQPCLTVPGPTVPHHAFPSTGLLRALIVEAGTGAGGGWGPGRGGPVGGLSVVEGSDQRVGAVVEAGRVGVPEPHVQGHQVRVPEVERRTGLRAAGGGVGLAGGGHEGAIPVVAGGGGGTPGG